MKKELLQTFNIIFNSIVFFVLIGTAFALSFIFGLLFVLAFGLILYDGDIKRRPLRMMFIFAGGLLTRYALGQALMKVSNAQITLDFLVSILMIIFIFLLGWRMRKHGWKSFLKD